MRNKPKTPKERKFYSIQLSVVHLILLIGGMLVVCLWMFVLGVLTGRGVIFTKISWLGIEGQQAKEATAENSKITAETQDSVAEENLNPEKIEKQLEFFHNLDKAAESNRRQRKVSSKSITRKPGKKILSPAKGHQKEEFFILVASFRKKEMADVLAKKLDKYGYKGSVDRVELKEKGVWFRVCVGNYAKKAEASKHAKRIREKFRISPLVMLVSR